MFRFLIQFVALLVFFAVARSVLTWILRTAASSFRATAEPAPPQPERADTSLASAGELYRDPVCGTFVPGNSGFIRNVAGKTVYFCSADCRERFLVSAHP